MTTATMWLRLLQKHEQDARDYRRDEFNLSDEQHV